MADIYDAIIIGAGHNGLVTGCYLAKAGMRVLMLENRNIVGGACVTETDTFPGYRVSTLAYVNSLFRKEIIEDLQMKRHGFEMLERNPSSYTPLPDGRHLLLGPDSSMTHSEIAKFSKKDALNYPKYEAMLEKIGAVVEPLLIQIPPNLLRPSLKDLWKLAKLALGFKAMGPGLSEAFDLLAGPAKDILENWFESEPLKGTLATDAVIGAFSAPSAPGTGYVLFHHVMGETNGKKGVWGYVKGGMGEITRILADIAKAHKTQIKTGCKVERILVKGGRAVGVACADGNEYFAKRIISNADAHVTFEKLLEPGLLPDSFQSGIRSIRYDSASLKINVALDRAPVFLASKGLANNIHLRGTVHICPDMEAIERAFDDAKYGQTSRVPILECTLPSMVDPGVAPAGKHLMSMFIQYAPFNLKGTTWETERDIFADRCFDLLETYAPGFKASVLARQVITPLDMERDFGLTGGNIFQGSMGLNRLHALRPLVGHSGYKTPIPGLFLCGSATHPGGGVTGACGYNAAKVILGRG